MNKLISQLCVPSFVKFKSFTLKKAEATKDVHQLCYVVAAVKEGWIFKPSPAPSPYVPGTRGALSLTFRLLFNNIVFVSEKLKIKNVDFTFIYFCSTFLDGKLDIVTTFVVIDHKSMIWRGFKIFQIFHIPLEGWTI